MSQGGQGLSVIIPAHNEGVVLPRLLEAICAGGVYESLEILVVANGCTDETARVAAQYQNVRVVEITTASKQAAVAEGDRQARYEARAYVDADVLIDRAGLERLFTTLTRQGLYAAAPSRLLVRTGVERAVRWYYDVWERLPQVRTGMFGRGVMVVSSEGHRRLISLPQVMSDDLMLSEAFAPHERAVVPEAEVTIWIPRTARDLIRRRTRVATGNAEMDELALRNSQSKTSIATLLNLLAESPTLLPKLVVFGGVTLVARMKSKQMVRRRDFTTWLRDESSRS